MLRASIDTHEQSVNLDAVMNGNLDGDAHNAGDGDGGATTRIQHAAELLEFATSTVTGTATELAIARAALVEVAGATAMIDAAGVASNFQRMVRIADSTGIELGDAEMAETTAELRRELDIEQFRSEDKRYF